MDANAVKSSIAQFSAKFCNELDKTKNTVSSPLSAEIVLALLTLGTEDPAHIQLVTSLGIPDDDAIRSSFSLVTSKLKAAQGVKLEIANKVYIKAGGYDLKSQLKDDAVNIFDAGIEQIDFNDGEKAADTINKWVETKTNEIIKDLFSKDSFDIYSRLVLINALYFKGTWENKFDPSNTVDKPFYVDATKTIDIPMMYKENKYTYGDSDALEAQVLQICYEGEDASMVVVLPREITGLDAVLQKLANGYDLLAELKKMYYTKVKVTLPKFKIETELDLKQLLPKLGISAIFSTTNSGLTKIMNTTESLAVSKAIQKAFIEVNEEGAEAAAATAMLIKTCKSLRRVPPVPSFVADHPFLAIILIDDTICFMATYRGSQ